MNAIVVDPTTFACDLAIARANLGKYYDFLLAWSGLLSCAEIPILVPTGAMASLRDSGLVPSYATVRVYADMPNAREIPRLLERMSREWGDLSAWLGSTHTFVEEIVLTPSAEQLGVAGVLRPIMHRSLAHLREALTGRRRGKKVCLIVKTAPSREVDIRPSTTSGRRAIVKLRLIDSPDVLRKEMPRSSLLQGVRLLIFGHEGNRQLYVQTAESFGARATFVNVRNDARVASALSGSTYDWYLRAVDWGPHVFRDQVKKQKLEDRTVLIDQSGVSGLRRILLHIAANKPHKNG